MVVSCEKVDNSDFCKDNAYPGWDDPILGSGFPNGEKFGACNFIASLSSVAWVWPLFTPPFMCRNPSGTVNGIRSYTIQFKLPAGNYTVEEKVARDAGNYIYSHSRNPLELWVALYEKAYVKRMLLVERCTTYAGAPWPVTPIGTLGHITGCSIHYELTSANIYVKIKEKCLSNKTKYATVVWSNNHAYSVLGFKVTDAAEYLILRDPSGVNAFIRNDILENTNWEIADHFYFNPLPSPGQRTGSRNKLVVSLTNGIFGLKSDRVQNNFQGAAWAGPP